MSKQHPEQVIELFEKALGEDVLGSEIKTRTFGIAQKTTLQIWLTINKSRILDAVRTLTKIQYPHLAVVGGCDTGETVELMYFFYVNYGKPEEEFNVTFKVPLPKDDLTIDSITELIPGALTTEREKQEFYGIKMLNIPDGRRIFLPPDFPEDVYPWRRDETGVQEDMINHLWKSGRTEEQTRIELEPEPEPTPSDS